MSASPPPRRQHAPGTTKAAEEPGPGSLKDVNQSLDANLKIQNRCNSMRQLRRLEERYQSVAPEQAPAGRSRRLPLRIHQFQLALIPSGRDRAGDVSAASQGDIDRADLRLPQSLLADGLKVSQQAKRASMISGSHWTPRPFLRISSICRGESRCGTAGCSTWRRTSRRRLICAQWGSVRLPGDRGILIRRGSRDGWRTLQCR